MSTQPQANQADRPQSAQPTALTPEQVRQLADKVYALWLKEIQIEQERQRAPRTGRRYER